MLCLLLKIGLPQSWKNDSLPSSILLCYPRSIFGMGINLPLTVYSLLLTLMPSYLREQNSLSSLS